MERQWGSRKRQLSAVLFAKFHESAHIIIQDMQFIVDLLN